jgi:hypothetical protein
MLNHPIGRQLDALGGDRLGQDMFCLNQCDRVVLAAGCDAEHAEPALFVVEAGALDETDHIYDLKISPLWRRSVGVWGREKGRTGCEPGPLRPFSLTGIDAVPPPESSDRLQATRGRGGAAAIDDAFGTALFASEGCGFTRSRLMRGRGTFGCEFPALEGAGFEPSVLRHPGSDCRR